MDTKSEFLGGLHFISLPDIFQILGGNRATGILQLTTQYAPAQGRIYFVEGDPVNASMGPLHGKDAIYALFGWSEGEFEFHEGNVQVGRVIKNSRMQITLDALRMLDDGMIEKVGPPDSHAPNVILCGLEHDKGRRLSVNKGPLIDYTYVLAEEYFSDGEIIVKEGSHGNWIWVILEGMVNITRETSNGPVPVARLGQGCFIGTLVSLLHGDNTRTATVTAMGEVQLGLLDAQRLSGEYASLSLDFRNLLFSLAGRLGKITDSTVNLFQKSYNTDGLTKGKQVIVEKGSSKEEIFTIIEGETYVIGETPKGDLPLFALQKKDVFGNVPFIDFGHEPRNAVVLASKDLKVDKLDPEKLRQEFSQLSGTFKNLIFDLGTCVSVTTRLACHL
ncbi:MAG: cyclic nucleotide-binding domain-containing protein [Deltaproteobacteria bacterium]|nr:cyclic nucleotide-binding domain-containing protein [Deltaproteobacteria bacterium]MBW2119670.1 cyclic nucleotide-binding domain-containing protein [Deltaproteobacteria bacterium]MBW2344934.1 cyclic nucleotide-binding domain-containing protein [Deltaproteobacteria bacterium]